MLYHAKSVRPRTDSEKARKRRLTATQHKAHHGQNLYRRYAIQTETAHFEKVPEPVNAKTIADLKAIVASIKREPAISRFKPTRDTEVIQEPKAKRRYRQFGG